MISKYFVIKACSLNFVNVTVAVSFLSTLIIQIHDRSLSRLGTDTSIKDGGVKLVLLAKISSLSEIMLLCQCFPHVCKSIVFVFVAVLYHDFIYQHSTCLAKLKTSRICLALIFRM
jgi:hypothetical protein